MGEGVAGWCLAVMTLVGACESTVLIDATTSGSTVSNSSASSTGAGGLDAGGMGATTGIGAMSMGGQGGSGAAGGTGGFGGVGGQGGQNPCGDNSVDPLLEECDDGNAIPGDGCDATCQLEATPGDDCASAPTVAVFPGVTDIEGNTLFADDDHGFQGGDGPVGCEVTDSGGGKDQVIALVPQIGGDLALRVGFLSPTLSACEENINHLACWDRVLSVRHACADVSAQILCAGPGVDPTYVQELTFAVVANETYYVFIDSFWDGGGTPSFAAGPYTLDITLTP